MSFPTVRMTHKDHGEATVPADEVSEWKKRGWVEIPPPKAEKPA